MKKYLEDLKQELLKKKLTNKEIEEILTDHEEMIQNAMDEGLSEDEINEIQKGLDDIKKGRVFSIDSVARELGITLK